jgi:hypothetical protein
MIGVEQTFLRGLEVGIARAAPPYVGTRVRGLGLDLGIGLAGALADHGDLGAGRLLEGGGTHPALLLQDRAIEGELALRLGGRRREAEEGAREREPAMDHGWPPWPGAAGPFRRVRPARRRRFRGSE